MELVKLGNSGRFNSAVYHRFIHSIVSFITFIIGFICLAGLLFVYRFQFQVYHRFILSIVSSITCIIVFIRLLAFVYFSFSISGWFYNVGYFFVRLA